MSGKANISNDERSLRPGILLASLFSTHGSPPPRTASSERTKTITPRFKSSSAAPLTAENTAHAYAAFLDHLQAREGYKNEVYRDRNGFAVGVGHFVKPEDGLKPGDRISHERVRAFLKEDGRAAFKAACAQATQLGINDCDFVVALASVNFQLGTGWRQNHPDTWALMQQGRFAEAARNLENTKWNRQTPVRVADFQAALLQQDDRKKSKTGRRRADNFAILMFEILCESAQPAESTADSFNSSSAGKIRQESAFDAAIARVMGSSDRVRTINGTLVKYGISQRANPDIDVAKLTRDDAVTLYRERYWNGIRGINRMTHEQQLEAFELSYTYGAANANRMLATRTAAPKLVQ